MAIQNGDKCNHSGLLRFACNDEGIYQFVFQKFIKAKGRQMSPFVNYMVACFWE